MADPAPLVRVLWPLALGLVGASGAVVGLGLLGFGPDVVRLLLVGAVVGAVASVLLGTQSTAPTWESRYDRPAGSTGQDVRTSAHLRVIEGNRTAAEPSPALRERLRALTEQTVGVRHGTTLDDPAARRRVGPRLRAVLDGPPRRLSVAELDACLDEIEGL